ncbi:DUF4270 family protein [Chitinophaga solisilvae]|uniref:DUF4270 family protein n=1 Tax=Chitinophaga solisilvae TaxID=1233460 RepID=UPI00136E3151|nr:DUF4270 family protein [Chitinophaga solisilvae]
MNYTVYRLLTLLQRNYPRCSILSGILLLTTLYSCQKQGFTYENVVDNQQTDYILTDTLSVTMKTIRYDSVPTSGTGTLLAGFRADPLFGKYTVSSFFQIGQPATWDIPVNGSQYDSLLLIMRPNGYVSGDSTIPQHLQVLRVTQKIQFAKNFSSLYNNSNFSTESTVAGTFSGIIRPNTDKTIRIRMTDALGSQLFTMLRTKHPDITDITRFLEFFKGLKIAPGPGSQAVTGFQAQDTGLVLRLYYHQQEMIPVARSADFKLNAADLQFNQVTADRSGTPIAGFSPTVKELPSAATGNGGFIQSVTGVATRIDIPYLKNMLNLGQFFKMMKVVLTVTPAAGSYASGKQLPPNLAVCAVNKANEVTDTLSYGNLTVDNLYNERTGYTFDITSYCNSQLTADILNTRGLLLTTPGGAYRTSLDRLVINDQLISKGKIKVQVYYLLYK